jgi:uncharacterized membrane protein HdeD (DUF308 family)
MVRSGSSPLAVLRDGMWGFLLFAAVAWLAIAWSVLRLEPTDVARVAGPVVLFGALTEAVRAFAGTRTWWLNAGMATLFAATGVIVLLDTDSSFTTPAALVGWYLMVRGAADIAVSMLTRETDRIWGLLLVVGVAEAGLGFFAASPFGRAADLLIVLLGGLGLARGVADLVAALRLREAPRPSMLTLSPERAAGVAGYSAGLTDYESAPARGKARHRAAPRTPIEQARDAAPAGPDAPRVDGPAAWNAASGGDSGTSFHDEVLRTTADLDMMLALAGMTGAAAGAAEQHDLAEVQDTPEGVERAASQQPATAQAPPKDVHESPVTDPLARTEGAAPGGEDTAITRGRLVD